MQELAGYARNWSGRPYNTTIRASNTVRQVSASGTLQFVPLGTVADIYAYIYIYSHVHSHILHPFNDYVDSICTHVKDKFRRTSLAIGPIGIELIRSADHYCAHLCSSVSQQLVLGDEAHLGHLASIEPKCIGRSIDGDGMSPLEAVHDGLYTREVKGVQYNICTGTPVN